MERRIHRVADCTVTKLGENYPSIYEPDMQADRPDVCQCIDFFDKDVFVFKTETGVCQMNLLEIKHLCSEFIECLI